MDKLAEVEKSAQAIKCRKGSPITYHNLKNIFEAFMSCKLLSYKVIGVPTLA